MARAAARLEGFAEAPRRELLERRRTSIVGRVRTRLGDQDQGKLLLRIATVQAGILELEAQQADATARRDALRRQHPAIASEYDRDVCGA